MPKPWIALAGAAALLSACASAPHSSHAARGGAVQSCAAPDNCERKDPGKRQYYDEHAHRYYYYDGAAGRYFWEDGAPRD